MTEKLLTLHAGPASHSPYPWALSVIVEHAPAELCPRCGKPIRTRPNALLKDQPGLAKLCGGHKWSDMIGCGNMPPPFIVSRRVVDVLRTSGMRGFQEFPVDLWQLEDSSLRTETSPGYFWLQVHGTVEIDLKASGIEIENPCPTCGRGKRRITGDRLVPAPGTWDGSAIFMARNFPSNYVFCSEAILELARQHRWTNFGFKVMGIPDSVQLYWEGIDYLGSKWPPDWYPPGYSP